MTLIVIAICGVLLLVMLTTVMLLVGNTFAKVFENLQSILSDGHIREDRVSRKPD